MLPQFIDGVANGLPADVASLPLLIELQVEMESVTLGVYLNLHSSHFPTHDSCRDRYSEERVELSN